MINEAFLRARKLPENQDPTRQFALKQALAMLKAAEVADPRVVGELMNHFLLFLME